MFDPDYDLFLSIIESGSISAAARVRGQSVAAYSKRLAQLEQRLNAQLINRTTRRLALTATGEELFNTLMPIRAALKAAEDHILGRSKEISGPLRITAPTSFGRLHVLPCLERLLQTYPGIQLHIDLSDEFVDLLAGRYDLAIRIGPNVGRNLLCHRLGTSRRVLCAAPAYLARFNEPNNLDELAHHRLLATDSQLPWHLSGPEGAVIQNGASHVRTNSSEVVRELALSGQGISLRSLWDVGDALATGALKRILVQYEGSQDVGIYAVHGHTPALPARVRAMIDVLSAHLRAAGLV
jgi:Transcriptional regulator